MFTASVGPGEALRHAGRVPFHFLFPLAALAALPFRTPSVVIYFFHVEGDRMGSPLPRVIWDFCSSLPWIASPHRHVCAEKFHNPLTGARTRVIECCDSNLRIGWRHAPVCAWRDEWTM